MNQLTFNQLSDEAKAIVKEGLKAYSETHLKVNYFTGELYASGALVISNCEQKDKYIGTYYSKEVFTLEERIVNYVECFRDYPMYYKGKKSYLLMKQKWASVDLVDGDIIFNF